jgi:hypothetical protein
MTARENRRLEDKTLWRKGLRKGSGGSPHRRKIIIRRRLAVGE